MKIVTLHYRIYLSHNVFKKIRLDYWIGSKNYKKEILFTLSNT